MPTSRIGNKVPSPVWIASGLVILNLVVYAQASHFDFVNFDDPDYVYQNPFVTAGLTWHGVLWALKAELQANWHPVTWFSHMADAQLYGVNAGGHHMTSVFFHILNSVLLFWLFYRMTQALGKSAFVAAVFAVHPLHVESVAWISERKDVLSTFFWMLTIWAYLGYIREPKSRRYVPVVLFFALGLMAKPMIVTLPFVLLLLDFWPLRRLNGERISWSEVSGFLYEKVPLFLLTLASSIVTFIVQQHGRSVMAVELLPIKARAANALMSYVSYVAKTFWPANLAAFYPYPYSLPDAVTLTAVFFGLLASTGLAIIAAKRYPYVPVGWFWFLGTLLPVIGLVQVGSQSIADRYTYVPIIGLSIILSWGVPDLFTGIRLGKPVLACASGLVLLLLVILADLQVRYWENSVAMWSHALDVTSNNFMAHYALGAELGALGRHQEAADHLQEALRINPEYTPAYYNLGIELGNLGRLREASIQFSEAIRRDPSDTDARRNLEYLKTQGIQ